MKNIKINLGSLPSIDQQTSNPRLINGYITKDGKIKPLPATIKRFNLQNVQAILKSGYKDRYIVVTNDDVFYIENQLIVEVSTIKNSGFPVRMAENSIFQVGIVNGVGAWVFDQQNNSFVQLGLTEGFDLTNPRDVTTLNTIMIVVGGDQRKWIISDPDNALSWQGNEITSTDSRMGNLIGCEVLNNNLFIFGEGAVERWVPSTLRTPQDFPFTQDPSFQDEYGLAATSSLISQNNELYYLSQNGQIRYIGEQGRMTITDPGIENIINGYDDLINSKGNYYHYNGQWFYQLSFIKNDNAFLYCSLTKKFSENTDLFLGNSGNFVIFPDGIYEISSDFTRSYKNITLQTDVIKPTYSNLKYRNSLNQVILEVTQGKDSKNEIQYCYLSLSKDNVSFGNTVRRQFSPIAKRNYIFTWYMNVCSNIYTFRWSLHVKTDITIETCSAEFN